MDDGEVVNTENETEIFVEETPKVKRKKVKPSLSAERKAELSKIRLENLRKGRETSARNRKRRAEAKRIQKSVQEAEVQHFLNLKKNAETFNPTELLTKISLLESKLDDFTRKKEEPKPEVKEVKPEVKEVKPEPKPQIQEPEPEVLPMYQAYSNPLFDTLPF